jgi:hypothetical protein
VPIRSAGVDRSTLKAVLALILVVSVPYVLLHHVYLALHRTVAGVTRASVGIVVADYNEVTNEKKKKKKKKIEKN